ncbi:MAG: 50S ribosomal protein L22 [Oscillospiraceae bacterium]|jgi:large subunit ribosomal protein L22|nr:50S ribosomal protein L22 [Oscillospiraceae bacterium]
MEAKAHLRHVRISPRKVSIVLDLIRNESAELARSILKYTDKAACKYLLPLLASAVANAQNNKNMNPEDLYVAECFVCPGKTLKRMRPGPKGRSFRILKRTSHITVVLKEKES